MWNSQAKPRQATPMWRFPTHGNWLDVSSWCRGEEIAEGSNKKMSCKQARCREWANDLGCSTFYSRLDALSPTPVKVAISYPRQLAGRIQLVPCGGNHQSSRKKVVQT